MKMVKLFIGIILGHVLWYMFNLCVDIYDISFWVYVVISWCYLIYAFLKRHKSKYWNSINEWLVPIVSMFCVIQIPLYIMLLFKWNIVAVLIHYLYMYRITLILELPLMFYICNKINRRLQNNHVDSIL